MDVILNDPLTILLSITLSIDNRVLVQSTLAQDGIVVSNTQALKSVPKLSTLQGKLNVWISPLLTVMLWVRLLGKERM